MLGFLPCCSVVRGQGVSTPDGSPLPTECLLIDKTVIPRMAFGVLHASDNRQRLETPYAELRSLPDGTLPRIGTMQLYHPCFVYKVCFDEAGKQWCLLGSTYSTQHSLSVKKAPQPLLGWVNSDELEFARNRYAYSFSDSKRSHAAALHSSAQDAYEYLVAAGETPSRNLPAISLLQERIDGVGWDPVAAQEPMPFIEWDAKATEHFPDTTPTFEKGGDNRLIHIGAICGGPINQSKLDELTEKALDRKPLEMLFVIDDTTSMQSYFPAVAEFVKGILGEAGEGEIKIAVSYYNDRADDKKPGPEPFTVEALKEIKNKQVADAEALQVEQHREVRPTGDGAQPEELMCEGLLAAIEKAGFSRGATAFVVVIGDTGDRSEEPSLKALLNKIARECKLRNLQLFFAHVGPRVQIFQQSFKTQADRLAALLPGKVTYQTADSDTLAQKITEARRAVENERRQLLAKIAAIKSRQRFAVPGPLMEHALEKGGLTIKEFDDAEMQVFVPASGWLYHPQHDAAPQLRELFFLCEPETKALIETFALVSKQFEDSNGINGDAALDTLATSLGKSGHITAESRLREQWQQLQKDERSLGILLRDVYGLRVKNPLLYRPSSATKAARRAQEAVDQFNKSITLFRAASGLKPFWFDSWKVLP